MNLPHSKDARWVYHEYGKAVLASRLSQLEMFCACFNTAQDIEGKRAILLGPLPQYIFSRCCKDNDQVVELEDADHTVSNAWILDSEAKSLFVTVQATRR
jgi:hypothetical protein